MLPDWVSNPGPLTYESSALPIALRGPALSERHVHSFNVSVLPGPSSICECVSLSHTRMWDLFILVPD